MSNRLRFLNKEMRCMRRAIVWTDESLIGQTVRQR